MILLKWCINQLHTFDCKNILEIEDFKEYWEKYGFRHKNQIKCKDIQYFTKIDTIFGPWLRLISK